MSLHLSKDAHGLFIVRIALEARAAAIGGDTRWAPRVRWAIITLSS